MKLRIIVLVFALGTGFVSAQGTLVFDQQSTGPIDGTDGLSLQPMGQSFTPSLSSIDFVELFLGGGPGATGTVEVNLRSDSITGPILGTSTSVDFTAYSVYDFFFTDSIALTPGTKYYLQPFATSGSGVEANFTFIQYTGGDAVIGGTTFTDRDFWFGEGTISNVPEPPSSALMTLVAGLLIWTRRKQFAA